MLSCEDARTAALIEVQTDLGDALTRVEAQIRSESDDVILDAFSFDSARDEKHRVPFSFLVEPRKRADQTIVVKLMGYQRGDFLSEAKQRVQLIEGTTVNRVVRLLSACAGVRCSDGETCDPESRACAAIPSASSDGTSVPPAGALFDAATDAGSDAGSIATQSGGEAGQGGSEPDGGAAPAADGGVTRTEEPSTASGGASGEPGAAGASGAAAGGGGDSGSAAGSGGAGAAGGGGAGSGGAGSGGAGSGGGGAGGGGGGAGSSGSGGAGRGAGGVTGGGAGSGVLGERDDTASVMRDGRGYILQNNVYSPGASQTLRYEGTSFTITSVSGSDPAGVSFPAAYVGTVYRRASPGTNLPMRASEVESIEVSFSSNAGSVDGEYHMAHALWFSLSPEGDPELPTGGVLEVWYYVQGGHQPPGRLSASAVSVDGAPGTYDLWQGTCFERPCTFYVSGEDTTSYQGNLEPFLRDALARPNGVGSSWYLSSVAAGFEIHSGGIGLAATDISIDVR